MSDNENTEMFDRHASPPKLTVIIGGKFEKKPYQAYGIAAPSKSAETFLRIEYLDGEVNLMNKGHLVDVLCTSHQMITLMYNHCQILLMGNRLEKILDLIQDEGLRSLHCFHPERNLLPDEEDPVITGIERSGWPTAPLPVPPSPKPSTSTAPWLKGDA